MSIMGHQAYHKQGVLRVVIIYGLLQTHSGTQISQKGYTNPKL
jgi:hypothetical protein